MRLCIADYNSSGGRKAQVNNLNLLNPCSGYPAVLQLFNMVFQTKLNIVLLC